MEFLLAPYGTTRQFHISDALPHPPWHPAWMLLKRMNLWIALRKWTCRVVADTSKSKLLRDTSLSQHRVGGVPGQDFPVHGETSLRDRTVPDFVVTFAWPLKVTSMRAKNLLDARGVAGHQRSEGQDATIFVLVQHVKTRGPVAGGTVQLQQLGDKSSQFLNKNIR